MLPGLYSASSGMRAVEDRQHIIANNIANAATPGYKRQRAVQEGFYQLFLRERCNPHYFNQALSPGGGSKVVMSYSNYKPGILNATGNV